MKLIWLSILLASRLGAYAFLCNGVDADGNQESDSCGSCTDTNGPRWPNNSITFQVGTTVLPSGITASDWITLANSGFGVWTGVSGVLLQATYQGESSRSFGTTESSHDIFWVNSESEWMELVGAAPNGILGVTLPPYYCHNQTTLYRLIVDMDMILNAVGSAGFKWAKQCAMLSDDCQSIPGTLNHELGHGLGLGHPCQSCSSLMSANATYLVDKPQFDDEEGIRALYPSGATGGVGSKCSDSTSCTTNICHTQGSSQYCSKTCSLDLDCWTSKCVSGICEYPSGVAIGQAGQGDSCKNAICDQGLICVTVDKIYAYCFLDCTTSGICTGQETCHQLKNSQEEPINVKACIQLAVSGASCSNLPPLNICPSGEDCINGTCSGVGSPPTSGAPGEGGGGCSTAGLPGELSALILGLFILIHRRRKKC